MHKKYKHTDEGIQILRQYAKDKNVTDLVASVQVKEVLLKMPILDKYLSLFIHNKRISKLADSTLLDSNVNKIYSHLQSFVSRSVSKKGVYAPILEQIQGNSSLDSLSKVNTSLTKALQVDSTLNTVFSLVAKIISKERDSLILEQAVIEALNNNDLLALEKLTSRLIDYPSYTTVLTYLQGNIAESNDNIYSTIGMMLLYAYLAYKSSQYKSCLERRPLENLMSNDDFLDLADRLLELKATVASPILRRLNKAYQNVYSCNIQQMEDSIAGIFGTLEEVALASQAGRGIAVYAGEIRAQGGMYRGKKGVSHNLASWLKLFDITSPLVDQSGDRPAAISIGVPVWHRDIIEVLERSLEKFNANKDRQEYALNNVFIQLVTNTSFIKAVKNNDEIPLVDPHTFKSVKGMSLSEASIQELESWYTEMTEARINHTHSNCMVQSLCSEYKQLDIKWVSARRLWSLYIECTSQGRAYCSDYTQMNMYNTVEGNSIKMGNLCVESFTATSDRLSHLCQLLSINVSKYTMGVPSEDIGVYVRFLNLLGALVIPEEAKAREHQERFNPIGLGFVGIADFLATHKKKFDSDATEWFELVEDVLYNATKASFEISMKADEQKQKYAKSASFVDFFPKEIYERTAYNRKTDNVLQWRVAKSNSPKMREKWVALFKKYENRNPANIVLLCQPPNSTTSRLVGAAKGVQPIEDVVAPINLDASVSYQVAPNYTGIGEDNYETIYSNNTEEVYAFVAKMQDFIDAGISFSPVIDSTRITDGGVALSKSMLRFLGEQGGKTIYYPELITESSYAIHCTACAN